jgi:Na+-translocating ferredoxin:NAD+ oxidoreductase subunit E
MRRSATLNDIGYREINANGLWHNNPGLVQLLGLCPLLAISGTVVNALGLGIATTLTLVASNVTVSLIRHWVRPEIRIPVFVLIIASVVTAIELAMNAFFYELYLVLGIFIPLIVTNCAIIGRAEAFASKNPIPKALADGLAMGLGFTGVLVTLGALREVIGHGTLLADAHLMFGEAARDFSLTVIAEYRGFLLALLPPGAFIALGLIIALKNIIDSGLEKRAAARAPKPAEAVG